MVPRPRVGLTLPQEEHVQARWPRRELAGSNQLPHEVQNGGVVGGNPLFDGVPEVAAAQAGPDLDPRRRRQVEVRAGLD